ncbi:MAG TPA: D-alanine--D-alanine ligase family protein [bacterium]
MPSNDQKRRVAVLFGGRSAEHDVSITSALSIIRYIDKRKYEVVPIKISREGRWKVLTDIKTLDSVRALESAEGSTVLVGDPETKGLVRIGGTEPSASNESIDVVFPVLHGTYGEDGTIQGLFQLAGIPCVGGGVLASALGMDKVLQKQVFRQHGLPMAGFIWFLRKEWEEKPQEIRARVEGEIGFPCFVKPANLGSSVGIFKVKDGVSLFACLSKAAQYDRKLVVEKAVDSRELECAVLGNDEPEASVVGEIVPCNEFYDYEAKYLVEGSQTLVPADVPPAVSNSVRGMAVSAFKALDCSGMARVDFFLERGTDRVLINEINTIPGFTPISMYPKLWEASGIPYADLIDQLIELALARHADLNRSRFHRE